MSATSALPQQIRPDSHGDRFALDEEPHPSTGASPPPSLGELRRAWAAVRAGVFRSPLPNEQRSIDDGIASVVTPSSRAEDSPLISPWAAEWILPVIGCGGSTGATTFAVALATAACARSDVVSDTAGHVNGPAVGTWRSRVVDCSIRSRSGLVVAGEVELGFDDTGLWQQSRRNQPGGSLLLQRLYGSPQTSSEVPAIPPAEPHHNSDRDRALRSTGSTDVLTVLDGGWDVAQLVESPRWSPVLTAQTERIVLTTTATVPGLRRLDEALSALSALGSDRVVLAVLGPKWSRWPVPARHAVSGPVRRLQQEGLLVAVPTDKTLAVEGLTQRSLPRELVSAARAVLRLARPEARARLVGESRSPVDDMTEAPARPVAERRQP